MTEAAHRVYHSSKKTGFQDTLLMLIAVSSFGESLRRVLLTAPAEAI
jgi:hypothetical protein